MTGAIADQIRRLDEISPVQPGETIGVPRHPNPLWRAVVVISRTDQLCIVENERGSRSVVQLG